VKVRCWGSRGSVPVSGPEYLVHGGDTACLEIRTASDEVVIVDAGTGIRRLGAALHREGRRQVHLLVTHAHWDHILGFPFFKLLYVHGAHVDLYGCSFSRESIRDLLATTMNPPNFPVRFADVAAAVSTHDVGTDPFSIDSVSVQPVRLSHPNQGLGYAFTENGRRFVYLTDNELGFRHPGGLDYNDYREFVRGADLLIHDAELHAEEYRERRGWGHSTYAEAVQLALDAGVTRLGLFHHNQDRTDADITNIVADCRRMIEAAGRSLQCFAVTQETELEV
jgi:phosphoribosyl 1,2-cyclic phosphodiesterase